MNPIAGVVVYKYAKFCKSVQDKTKRQPHERLLSHALT